MTETEKAAAEAPKQKTKKAAAEAPKQPRRVVALKDCYIDNVLRKRGNTWVTDRPSADGVFDDLDKVGHLAPERKLIPGVNMKYVDDAQRDAE